MKLINEVIEELKAKQKEFDQNKDHKAVLECVHGYSNLMNTVPDDPQIIFQLATAYLQLGHFGIASQLYHRTAEFWPAQSHLWSNLGVCYRAMHMIPKSSDCFMKALMCEERAETYMNLAATYINENVPERGIQYIEKALAMLPDNGKVKWNAALLYLELKDWFKGFTLFESGLVSGERPMRFYTSDHEKDVAWWDGSENKTVALWDEQGLGDRILSYSLLRKLKDKNNVFIVECHDRLFQIVKRSFPWIHHVYPTSKQEKLEWPVGFKLEAKLPIWSLAKLHWLGGDFDRTPYLVPNPELVKKYREEIEKLGPPPYIAMSWTGGAPKTNTLYRALKLGWFKPLVECGGTWLSVQYHDFAQDKVNRFREETKLPIFHLSAAQEKDYDHTLAALAACDLTISACNTVIHTCGAAGLPCWVLVPQRRAWRYPREEFFPWYGDHIRQFHQEKDGDWDEIIGRIAAELKEKFFT